MNHSNWTCTTQVMVHFPRLVQLRLFNGLCPVFGTIKGLVSELSSELSMVYYGLIVRVFLRNMVDVDICVHDILT